MLKYNKEQLYINISIQYYKIESEINGVTGSTVLRRYNDFKDLYRKVYINKIIVY